MGGIIAAVFASGRTVDEEDRLVALLEILDPGSGAKIRAALQNGREKSEEAPPPAAGQEEDVTRWIQGLPIWSRPLEAGQLAGLEAGGPVVADVRRVPSVVRLRRVPLGVAPSAEVSRGRVVMAQPGILPD